MSFEVKLDPVEGMNAVTQSALTFLATHMPATASPGEEATKVRDNQLPDPIPNDETVVKPCHSTSC